VYSLTVGVLHSVHARELDLMGRSWQMIIKHNVRFVWNFVNKVINIVGTNILSLNDTVSVFKPRGEVRVVT
jgi:hypothetical protein